MQCANLDFALLFRTQHKPIHPHHTPHDQHIPESHHHAHTTRGLLEASLNPLPLIPPMLHFSNFFGNSYLRFWKFFMKSKFTIFLLHNYHFLSFSQTWITSKSQFPVNFDPSPCREWMNFSVWSFSVQLHTNYAQDTWSVSHGFAYCNWQVWRIKKCAKGTLPTESAKFLRFLHEITTTSE
jgi:hypothetical protein